MSKIQTNSDSLSNSKSLLLSVQVRVNGDSVALTSQDAVAHRGLLFGEPSKPQQSRQIKVSLKLTLQ